MTRDEDFTAYVGARWPSLVRAATYLGCTPKEAEDLAQETLVRCYRAWDRVSRADRQDAYVYRVLMNGFTRSRRRLWHGERPTAELPVVAAASEDVTDRLDLARVLAGLTPQHRDVLVLRYVADLSEAQTAAVLGVPAGTVKSRVYRALAAVDRSSLTREETR